METEVKLLLQDNAIPFELTKAGAIKFIVNATKYRYNSKTNKLIKWKTTVKNNELFDDGFAHLKVLISNLLTDEELEQLNDFKTTDNGDDKLNWGKYSGETVAYVHKTDIQYLKFMVRFVRNPDDDAYKKYKSKIKEHQFSKLKRLVNEHFYKLDNKLITI